MPTTKKKSVCTCKHTPVVTDNDDSDSDSVDNLATVEQPESEHETNEKRKRRAKTVMSIKIEDGTRRVLEITEILR